MKYHTTVSRRDFMKGLGLTGAGLSAAIAASPAFHDLDEIANSPEGQWKRSWWVKEADKPTLEIDWSVIKRHDASNLQQPQTALNKGIGQVDFDRIKGEADARNRDYVAAKKSGYSLKDFALADAANTKVGGSWVGPQKVKGPAKYGVSKWEGNPEENLSMIRSAMRFFGARQVAVIELESSTTKKIIWAKNRQGKPFSFENVEVGYENSDKFAVPDNCRWMITFNIPMGKQAWATAPALIGTAANDGNKARAELAFNLIQEFFRGLGYQCLAFPGGDPNSLCPSAAAAVLSGMAESSRTNHFITPEEGPVTRVHTMITDMPLAPTKPIDAGLFRFCHTCKRCSNYCPSEAISKSDAPSWDIPTPPPQYQEAYYSSLGKRAFWKVDPKCGIYQLELGQKLCGICLALCSFNVASAASVHSLIKPTISLTPTLNGFFWKMGDMMEYGIKSDPGDWWKLNLPVYDIDNSIGAQVHYH